MISRLAPSPTGSLHLGNARTFLINWALARRNGWKLLMRMEDLDGPRNKPNAAREALDVLNWLGLDYDGQVMVQSTDLQPYRAAMRELATRRLVYSCELSRKEIEAAASAPLADERAQFGKEVRFSPDLRPQELDRFTFDNEASNYRVVVPDETIVIDDQVMGASEQCPFREVGDFVVWTRRGQPSYQLAVIVDDARQGVTDVVRGDDLLSSASRQTLLYRMLDLPIPRWWHVPLVIGPDGRKLAKRHGDTRLATYRDAGVSPQRVIGLLAWWSGASDELREMSILDFRDRFDLNRLDRNPIVFTEEHHQWLLGASTVSGLSS